MESLAKAVEAGFAVIKPFRLDDPIIGQTVAVEVSPFYSKILVGQRTYYFVRETGEFDGTSCRMGEQAGGQ